MSGRVGLDLTPLRRSASFRRLYLAGFVTSLGSQATFVTVPYQLKQLTHSTLAVGTIGLVEVIPLVLFGLYGGVLADIFDRRRMIIAAEVGLGLCAVALLVNALAAQPQAWVLYVVVAVVAALASLQRPSLDALNQSLVPHELQREAATLMMVRYTTASIVGPAVGGLLVVAYGAATVYLVDIVSFCGSLALLASVRTVRLDRDGERPDWGALRQGVNYALSRRDLLGTYLIDVVAMLFAFPVAMLPFVADRFHNHIALSVLYCSLPLGALLATVTSRWTKRISHYGRAIVVAASLWGVGIAVFGATASLVVAAVGLIIAGGADAISAIFRQTMWNESIPPAIRGRMAGIEMISYSLGPTGGQFRAGLMASWWGLRASLALGGLVCAGTCLALPLALPALWRFDVRSDINVELTRTLRAADRGSEA